MPLRARWLSACPAVRRWAIAGLFTALASFAAQAGDWPPPDPAEPMATVTFDTAWASAQRDIRDFRQLQQAAGARGQIIEIVRGGDSPHAVFGWTGRQGNGRMRALLYENGDFSAIITPAGATKDILLNNFGGFDCPICSPPALVCGRRPSWIPHDLHWDIFDCPCTLAGPQGLHIGKCGAGAP